MILEKSIHFELQSIILNCQQRIYKNQQQILLQQLDRFCNHIKQSHILSLINNQIQICRKLCNIFLRIEKYGYCIKQSHRQLTQYYNANSNQSRKIQENSDEQSKNQKNINQRNYNTYRLTNEENQQNGMKQGLLYKILLELIQKFRYLMQQISRIVTVSNIFQGYWSTYIYLINKKFPIFQQILNMFEKLSLQSYKPLSNKNQNNFTFEYNDILEQIKLRKKSTKYKLSQYEKQQLANILQQSAKLKEITINQLASHEQKLKKIKQVSTYFEIWKKYHENFNCKNPIESQDFSKYQICECYFFFEVPKICWNCFPYLIKNQQLNPTKYMRSQYTLLDRAQSQDILKRQNHYKLDLAVCSILNQGHGTIFLGIKSIPQQFTTQQQQIFNLTQTSSNKISRYYVQGVFIDKKISQYKNYLTDHILQNIFKNINISNHQKYIQISYIPVLYQYSPQNQRNLYVIGIKFNFTKLKNEKVYYLESKGNFGKLKYSICKKDKYKSDFQLKGEEIYEYMHTKYRQFMDPNWKTNMYQHNYPIKCSLSLLNHEYIDQICGKSKEKGEEKQNIIKSCKQEKYYNIIPHQGGFQDIKVQKQQNAQQLKTQDIKLKVPKLLKIEMRPTSNIQNEDIFGQQPQWIFHYGSLLVVTQKGKNQKLHETFMNKLEQQKVSHQIYPIYEKLKNKQAQEKSIFFINHIINYKKLKQIFCSLDKYANNLALLDIGKQFVLKNSNNYTAAVMELQVSFHLRFPGRNFQVGMKQQWKAQKSKNETKIYFIFEEAKESLFSYMVLELLKIRCQFVNKAKVAELSIYATY